MRVTWFGGQCFRIHIDGQIVVTFPQSADAAGLNATELRSGADRVIESLNYLEVHAGAQAGTPVRLIDRLDQPEPELNVRRTEIGNIVVTSSETAVHLCLAEFSGAPESAVQIVTRESQISEILAVRNRLFPRALLIAKQSLSDQVWQSIRNAEPAFPVQRLEQRLAVEI